MSYKNRFTLTKNSARFGAIVGGLLLTLLASVSADTLTPAMELLSLNSEQTGSGNRESSVQAMTPDGRYVVFISSADNLVATSDTNTANDVFVRDRQTGTTTLVSVNSAGTATANGTSKFPTISDDGRFVAFTSNAGNLTPSDYNNQDDIYVRDLLQGTTKLVSISVHGTGGSSDSRNAKISGNGRFVVFNSNSRDLVGIDTNEQQDVYLRDLQTNVTRLVSLNYAGTASGVNSADLAAISPDGRYVLFSSAANNLVSNDTNTVYDAFLRDMQLDVTRLVSINSAGTVSSNSGSSGGAMTPDARYVVFMSNASDLVVNDGNNFRQDVFVRDMVNGTTAQVSVNQAGTAGGNNGSGGGSITPNGRYILFTSTASNLTANDTNSFSDVYLRDLQTGATTLISINHAGVASGNNSSGTPMLSVDGRYAAFYSNASDITANDLNENLPDIFVRDTQTQMTRLVSVNINGSGSGNGYSSTPLLSADGRYLAFTSSSNDLVLNDTNGQFNDVFMFDTQQAPPQDQLQFSAPVYTINESGGMATVTVNRVGGVSGTLTTTYVTANVSAIAGEDYTAVSGTLVFAPGENSKSFTVPILEDAIDEAAETLSLSLTGNSSSAVISIQDNDAQPSFTINEVSVIEGNSGIAYARFTVTQTPASQQTTSVIAATTPDTASPNIDYSHVGGTLTFAPGQTTRTFDVPVISDIMFEPDETFNVFLFTPINATIADDRAVGTILNDDSSAINMWIEDASLIEGASGSVNIGFTVRLSAPSAIQIGFSAEVLPGTATQNVDYQWMSGGGTFFPGTTTRTVAVPINGDLLDEPDETFMVRIYNPMNGAVITRAVATGTIIDDDATTAAIYLNDVRVSEARAGTYAAVFTASLSAVSGHQVSVNYATSDGTATAGLDYQAASGILTFNPGQTSKQISVLIEADTLEEAEEIFHLNLSNPANATLARSQVSGTIRDYRNRIAGDFDGDGRSDLSVFRPSSGYWYINHSSDNALRAEPFGLADDRIVPGDYDGDEKTDVAVFRSSNGYWYILNSSDNSFRATQFGQAGDLPLPGDYDNDGKADIAVYRSSNSTLYQLRSSDGSFHFQKWGQAGDVPLLGDYDGDGQTDLAIYRASATSFYILRSMDGTVRGQQWGASADKPVAADFDGDGKTDICVYRPSTGEWHYLQSSDNGVRGIAWGASGDVPAAGDYDGDGKWDAAIFRPSTGMFYILQSATSALRAEQFGANGDVPVPSAYLPQ